MSTSVSKRFPWMLIILSIPALAVLLALGTWQVQRLEWKEDLLAKIEAQQKAAPVSVTRLAAQLDAATLTQDQIDYLPASATGRFLHEGESHFFATHKGISGYYIYTPLALAGADSASLFVNRGFVPFDLKEASSRPESMVQGDVTIEGLARQKLDAKPSSIVPDNDLDANIYYWKDIAAMAQQAGFAQDEVLPFFLDAGFPENPGTLGQWPVDGVTLINLPNNHLQYAVTWYGLAGALVVVLFVFMRRRLT